MNPNIPPGHMHPHMYPHPMHPMPPIMPPTGHPMPMPPPVLSVPYPGMPPRGPIPGMPQGNVIIGAPVVRAPLAPGQHMPPPPPAWSPVLTTAAAPPNPLMTTPLTLYIGKIPKFIDEMAIQQILEFCGKISKWNRLADSNTSQLKAFGFCTFSTGVNALRCYNVLADYDFSPYCPDLSKEDGGLKLQVKAGSKEQAVLDTLKQIEAEFALNLPPSMVKDLDGPVRQAIQSYLIQKYKPSLAPAVSEANSSLNADAAARFLSGLQSSSTNSNEALANGAASSSKLLEIGTLAEDDPNREKLVLSEIDKFRLRQAQRDKEVENLRKAKIKERIDLLKKRQENAVNETNKDAKDQNKREREVSSIRPQLESEEEAEAKRRRKQQVLDMLAGDATALVASTSTDALASESNGQAATVDLPQVKIDIKFGSVSSKSKNLQSTVFKDEVEEARSKVRSVVQLDITDEERRNAQLLNPIAPAEGFAGVNASNAHARAVADVISQKQQLQSVAQAETKALVDQIPTDRDGLFAYVIDWDRVAKHEIVESVLRKWVAKKVSEFLGEEEPALVDHIVSQLNLRCKPRDLLNDLEAILDDEAEAFVLKLWRMLIFSFLRAGV